MVKSTVQSKKYVAARSGKQRRPTTIHLLGDNAYLTRCGCDYTQWNYVQFFNGTTVVPEIIVCQRCDPTLRGLVVDKYGT